MHRVEKLIIILFAASALGAPLLVAHQTQTARHPAFNLLPLRGAQ
jgi:hypothetical protein